MPTLPQPGVSPRGLGQNYQTDRAYDGSAAIQRGVQGLAQDVSQAGQQFGQAVSAFEKRQEAEKQKADTVKVNNGLTALDKEGTDTMYGTANPSPEQAADAAFDGMDASKGYLASKGLTAQEISKGTYDRLQKKAQEIHDTMDVDQQRMFDAQSQRLLQQYYERIEGHASSQRQQAAVDSLKAAELEAQRAAALNPADDKQAAMSIGRIVGAQDQFATSTEDAFAKAEEVQGRVTAARLEALLAQPGGFTDAERVLEQNKGSIARMGRLDEYSKRIEGAKLGGRAAVEASRIVDTVTPSVEQMWRLQPPSMDGLEQELSKLAAKDPALYEKVAPMARAQFSMRAQAIKQEREAFIDSASASYNKNHSTFFASDQANRLNDVDPDKYRSLWNETYHRARAARGDAGAAKEEQLRDQAALLEYKVFGDGDLAARTGLNLDTWLAGKGVSPNGALKVKQAQALDKAKQQKGLEVNENSFVRDVSAELRKFAPDPGSTKKSRAATAQWWAEQKADAINAFTNWTDANPGKKPDAAVVRELKASVIARQRPNPKKPESIDAAARAINVQGGAGKPTRTGRKKVHNGVTYFELTDGSTETE